MAIPPKPGANPKLGAVDPTASRALINVKRAETLAIAENTKALGAQTRALQTNARAADQDAKATQLLADAEKKLGKNTAAATAAGGKAVEAAEDQSGAFDKLEEASRMAGRAIGGVEAAYKLYVAAHYDSIRAATMSARLMKEIPKTADAAGAQIVTLTKNFEKLRLKTQDVADKFIIPWKEADIQIDQILTSFGAHARLSSEAAQDDLVSLYERMRSVGEFTGESFDEQLQNIDMGLTKLGMSAEAWQNQVESMAKAPGMLAGSIDKDAAASGRYKDILKSNGVIRSVQDMVKSLNEENISVKALSTSYTSLITKSIAYGRTQQAAIEYATKMTKALAGSGSKTDMFEVPEYLAGQKMMASLKASGLGAGGAKGDAAKDAQKQQFLSEMGVKAGEKPTVDQDKQATKKVNDLMDVLSGGDINAGAIGAFATTKDRMHAKVQSAQDFTGTGNLFNSAGPPELPMVQVLLKQILGVEEAGKIDAKQFADDVKANNGDLEKTLIDTQEKNDTKEFGPGEKGAAAKIAHDRLVAESLNVLMDNALGPNGDIVKTLVQELATLTTIEGAIGAMAAVITMGSYKAGEAAADSDLAKNKSAVSALRGGTATEDDIDQAQTTLDRMNDRLKDDSSINPFVNPLTDEERTTMEGNVKTLNDALNQFKTGDAHRRVALSTTVEREAGSQVGPPPPATTTTTTTGDVDTDAATAPGFRTGISNIPYDDYLAQLHQGEAVLTKQQNRTLRDAVLRAPQPTAQRSRSGGDAGGGDNNQAAMNGNMNMDAKVVGDKLVFTVNDAGGAIAQLLLQAKNNNIS